MSSMIQPPVMAASLLEHAQRGMACSDVTISNVTGRGSQNVRLGPQGTFDPPSWVGLRSPAQKIKL